ncbi:MAG TPA: oligosaccharide flippase family protein, partial [Candidatus Omnitrophota bacterium]|nr:oligosaccharide flippase family protein [Candidatus Omnitrophota bacterium]
WLAALAAGVMPFLVLPFRRIAWPRGVASHHPGILRFFLLTSFNSIIALAPTHLATLIVGTLLGPAAAGLFRVAKQFADAAAKPAEFLAQALYPEAARLSAADDHARLKSVLRRLSLAAFTFAALAVALLAGLGEIVLRLAAGSEFAAAAPVMTALVVASGLAMAAAPVEPVLIALGQAGRVVAIKAAVAALHVALLLVLAQAFGLLGAGVAAAVAAAGTFILLWGAARKAL